MKIKKYFLTLFSCTMSLWACESNTIEPNPDRLGFQFFPLSLETAPVFEVEEINYRNDGTIDTSYYLLQDDWTESMENEQTTVLQGYRERIDQNGKKEISSTIQAERNPQTASVKLGNEVEVKLSFPVKERLEWNGTPFADEPDEFTLYKVFQPYTLKDSTFGSTLQVIQEDNQDSVLNYDQRIEVYAADIGLIYKITSQLEFCNETECLGLKEIEFGKTLRITRVF